jgi:uncharacterized protein (UPF0276 family)
VRAGIGLRHPHHAEVIASEPRAAWLEVHTENFLGGGSAPRLLETLRHDYAVSLHGVGLSLGTADGLDREHLARVAALVRRVEPCFVSEHVSWSVSGGVYLNDLLPLPYTPEALAVLCRNVDAMQEALGGKVLMENPSTYLQFTHSTIPEWEFIAELARRTGCGLLLDVNNVYVSACNHGFDAEQYIGAMPAEAVGEIHLAGHAVKEIGDVMLRIDDHGSAIDEAVWSLYRRTVERIGPRPTLIEWDCNIPPLAVLLDEAAKAQAILDGAGVSRGVAA